MVAHLGQCQISSNPKSCISLVQKKGPLSIQCDEMRSFVGNKKNKQWIWLVRERETHEIVGIYVGVRSRIGAEG